MDIIKSLIVWFIGLFYMVILFPVTFLIWLLVFPFDREKAAVHWLLVYQSLLLSKLMPIWKLKVEGRNKAVYNETYVIISNHQSLLDILLLNSLCYRFRWISKIENTKLPVLGWYLRMADYITVNRGNEDSKADMLEKSYRSLKGGVSIMIFPEGTRSADNEIGFFKRGAFQLAIQAGVSILPVIVDGTGDILPKHGLLLRSGHNVRIKVLDPVPHDSFFNDTPEELALRLNSIMKAELNKMRNNQ